MRTIDNMSEHEELIINRILIHIMQLERSRTNNTISGLDFIMLVQSFALGCNIVLNEIYGYTITEYEMIINGIQATTRDILYDAS